MGCPGAARSHKSSIRHSATFGQRRRTWAPALLRSRRHWDGRGRPHNNPTSRWFGQKRDVEDTPRRPLRRSSSHRNMHLASPALGAAAPWSCVLVLNGARHLSDLDVVARDHHTELFRGVWNPNTDTRRERIQNEEEGAVVALSGRRGSANGECKVAFIESNECTTQSLRLSIYIDRTSARAAPRSCQAGSDQPDGTRAGARTL